MARRFRLRAPFAVAAIVAAWAVTADAATSSVTNTNDSGPGSLREAVATANTSPGADTITFAPGLSGTIALTSGALVLDDDVEIQGPGANVLTVSAGGSSRVLAVNGGTTATVSGLTVADGRVDALDGADAVGGQGGDGSSASLFIGGFPGVPGSDAFGASRPAAGGGGISNSGNLTLERVVVRGNRIVAGDAGDAHGGDGGNGGDGGDALNMVGSGAAGGAGGSGGDATGGDGGNGLGGGIYNQGSLVLHQSTVTGNLARPGDGSSAVGGDGGDGGDGGNGSGSFSGGPGGVGGAGGSATGGEGGDALGAGIANRGTLIVENSTVSGNSFEEGVAGSSAQGGAGGSTGADGSPGNSGGAAGPGGVSLGGGSATANANGIGFGGGLHNDSAAGTAIRSATVADNGGLGFGANIATVQGPVTLRGTIVAGGAAPGSNCAAIGSGTITSLGHNLENLNTCNLNPASSDLPSSIAQVGPLALNGGATPTRRPGPQSGALDAIPAGNIACPATDQRGALRPGGAACDIGAYELAPPGATTGDAVEVTSGRARLTGIVDPRGLATTYRFEYGPTVEYGSETASAEAAGASAVGVSAAAGGLTPDTTYHYRLVTSGPDGTTTGADRTFTTGVDPAPRITRLAVVPDRFAVGSRPTPINRAGAAQRTRRGTRIRFRLSEAASVALTMQRSTRGVRLRRGGPCRPATRRNLARARSRCRLFVRAGRSLRRAGRAGANAVAFSGRIGRRALRLGAYRVSVVARDAAGNRSAPRRAGFRVVRARR